MSLFRNRVFLASSLGHMVLDVFNSSRTILLAFFSETLLLTDGMIGLTIGLYQFMGSLSQPLFGWVDDQFGTRFMMGLSILWSTGFIVLGLFAARAGSFFWMVFFFVVASFGSAAFHPLGTKYAASISSSQAATATAYFFLFGQIGLASGPLLAGIALELIGPLGIPLLALLTVPVIIFVLSTALPQPDTIAESEVEAVAEAIAEAVPDVNPTVGIEPKIEKQSENGGVNWQGIGVIILHTFCRSWAQIGTIAFVPKLFLGKGWDPLTYGAITSVMWLTSAVAGVVAGNLADRYGRRQVVFISMILVVVPLYLLPVTNALLPAFILAALVGGLGGAPHSIIVVIAQGMLPSKKATASGLILGLIFGMGSFAAVGIGWLADLWTLERALQVGAVLALIAGLAALALPSTRQVETIDDEVEKVAV